MVCSLGWGLYLDSLFQALEGVLKINTEQLIQIVPTKLAFFIHINMSITQILRIIGNIS